MMARSGLDSAVFPSDEKYCSKARISASTSGTDVLGSLAPHVITTLLLIVVSSSCVANALALSLQDPRKDTLVALALQAFLSDCHVLG